MIKETNFELMINYLGFIKDSTTNIYEKKFPSLNCSLKVDFNDKKMIYPESEGLIVNDKTTCNFLKPENFVVFECVHRLLNKGYRPEHIELEKKWTLGHDQKSGKADIFVYDKTRSNVLFIIECKKSDEYSKFLKQLLEDGGQLFSYWQQERASKWLCLYASDFDTKIKYSNEIVNCSDDPNILAFAKKSKKIKTYANSHSVVELFDTWNETYEKQFSGDVIFGEDTVAYNIGQKPLRKKDLIDFSDDDKIVNKFEEILRHNNISDKENAFNRLIALFICKLVDEINKSDEDTVEFQYKSGTDTYESLQDRLQKLHQEGMDKFMKEKIYYVSDDYAENLVQQYTGQKREKMIAELNKTLRILKFYTNNDFAFKDVHNEELFFQNGKILVEVVELFQKFRIINSNCLQLLGDLFEQLLNKGFKQNEGQFFTPTPITRFIWKSLPFDRLIKENEKVKYPKIIDYACGAGHFLTQGIEEIDNFLKDNKINIDKNSWVDKNVYGIEKDYRLARVSKISLFMHGAGEGNIIFGDGLENYIEKGIEPNTFDILVANPPYSVSAFKPHLKLSNNTLSILKYISSDGSEIETLFVERISQLVKPNGLVAVVLPSSILNKENNSYIAARATILENFELKAMVLFGGKTFGATGTNTVVLFMKKYNEPPKKTDLITDSVDAIFKCKNLDDWEDSDILNEYLKCINTSKQTYFDFINRAKKINDYSDDVYFGKRLKLFIKSKTYLDKVKQKSFIDDSEKNKNDILAKLFYDYLIETEKNKMFYFGLTYKQQTLVVISPSDNNQQEKFLGYKWSNRKGQEGIQIIKDGGMLYDIDSNETISTLIKDSFMSITHNYSNLKDMYFYSPLCDLVDFNNTSFNKIIKTVPKKKLKTGKNLLTLELSDKSSFEICIGSRVLSSDFEEEGTIPVISSNVNVEFGRINKEFFSDYSKEAVLWGIDGDWSTNIVPANYKFYPTDHCGVIKVLTDKIRPKYLRYALWSEGKFQRYTRNNRPSQDRIENLILQFPLISVQDKFIKQIETFDKEYEQYEQDIVAEEKNILNKFNELFSLNNGALLPFEDVLKDNTSLCDKFDSSYYNEEGEVPIVDQSAKFICGYKSKENEPYNEKSIIFGDHSEKFKFIDFPFYLGADGTKVLNLINNEFNLTYVYWYLKKNYQPTGKYERHYKYLKEMQIMGASISMQNEFEAFVNLATERIKEIRKKMDNCLINKRNFIIKEFA